VPVTGAVYATASPLNITANGPLTVAGLVIAATASTSGNLTVSYDPTNPAQAVSGSWLRWQIMRLTT
jgi:hypothetical protein